MKFSLGIDVGGTFTDFAIADAATGETTYFKVPSTPDDPSVAIENGLADIVDAGFDAAAIDHIGHGTTIATNIVIERAGAKIGLLTTRGFRDVLEIGRQQRPDLYDYSVKRPAPLVPRHLRLEVDGRLDADGNVVTPLDLEQVIEAACTFSAQHVEAVAVCFLHAYRFPEMERTAGALLKQELSGVDVTISSDVQPEFREFERFSTTTMNAYLIPKLKRYLNQLGSRVAKKGVTAQAYTIHSNGGLMSLHTTRRYPVRTCLSGPAAGVVGAAILARRAGCPDAITFDVGGTSTDVSLIVGGRPIYTTERDVAGYPVRCPMVDVHVIGAGGGSIAEIDGAGSLSVGPRSAAATPGPACYGLGGTSATLTDANVVLSRLDTASFLNGGMAANREAARNVVEQLAGKMGLDIDSVADGIVQVAIANMSRAIRAVATQHGIEPSEFALVAFGGAGPLHASLVAQETGLKTVIVPRSPGTMCAQGVLFSPISQNFVFTSVMTFDDDGWRSLMKQLHMLRDRARAWLVDEGVPEDKQTLSSFVEARYKGQTHELRIELRGDDILAFQSAFHAQSHNTYGYDLEARPIELVNCRVLARGDIALELPSRPCTAGTLPEAAKGERPVYFGADNGGYHASQVYERSRLPSNCQVPGPAVIEEMTATTLVLPGQTVSVDRFGNLVMTFGS